MVERWAWPALVGIFLGLAAAVLLFAPILVWQSRRFGRLSTARTVAAAAAAVYGVTLLAYTLLPLPEVGWCDRNAPRPVDLRPLQSLGDIVRATRGLSPVEALRTWAVLQLAMNVALFVPWGAFARRLFDRTWQVAVLSGVAMSAVIEATQATGIWGSYECAYRYGTLDDVLANGTGALVGALAAPALLWWVPRSAPDVVSRREPRPVTRWRRLAGIVVDVVLFYGVWAALMVAHRVLVLDRLDRGDTPDDPTWWGQTFYGVVTLLVVVVLPALVGSGASLGQRAMWLTPAPEHPGRRATALRLLAGLGGYGTLVVASSAPPLTARMADALSLLAWAFAGVTLGFVAFDPTNRGLSFRASASEVEDARSRQEAVAGSMSERWPSGRRQRS